MSAASAIADYADKHRIRKEQRAKAAAAPAQKIALAPAAPAYQAPSWMKEKLPAGWEMRLTKENRVYFVNHATKTTTFNDPREPQNKPLPAG